MSEHMDGDTPQPEARSTRAAVERLGPWFQNLHLPDGTQTAPSHFLGDYPRYKWSELEPELPADLSGWEVLDAGCNAGFYSIELARRGARVRAIDSNPHYLAQARWAASEFGVGDRVTFAQENVYGLMQDARGYDLVLFLGLFYHLRYPLLGLDILARRTRRLMALQTLTRPGEAAPLEANDLDFDQRELMDERRWPSLAFVEHRFAGDPTNWWVPNRAAVEALLRSAGMRVLARPGRELYLCEPGRPTADGVADDYEVVRSLVRRE